MSGYFNNKLQQPTDEMLTSALGETKKILDDIISFIETEFGESSVEWKFYGAKIGWTLKVFNKKRNVFFVGPEDGYFKMAFIFGNKAYLKIINSNLPDYIKRLLTESKVYMEGRSLQLEIRNIADAMPLQELVKIKLSN
jgi:hypothetical protein